MSDFNITDAKIAAKRPELEKLANSTDGKRVKELLGGDKIEQAAKRGDIAAIAAALQTALKTEEGARLANQLRELMK
ncbi:MAG: hypothetical protein LBN00_01120 [Oscillospiraceae bacterium]|jgi:hypothetical protein|nr:hypothetical protein [Oscillospiraceae bacterium]